jgi:cellulose biosynthesis protein BcsE
MQASFSSSLETNALAIANLPQPMILLHGNIYAIFSEDEQLADTLLWNTIHNTFGNTSEARRAVCMFSTLDIAKWIARVDVNHIAANVVSSKQLSLFDIAPFTVENASNEQMRHAMQHGVPHAMQQALFKDMQYFKVEQKSLIVIDGAHLLFSSAQQETLRAWHAYAEQHDCTVLFHFRKEGITSDESLVALQSCACMFAGMARITSRYGVTTLEIFHWFSTTGLIAKQSFPLGFSDDGQIKVSKQSEQQAVSVAPAADDVHTIALPNAFLAKEKIPESWQLFDGRAQDLLPHLQSAVAATVVLGFTPGMDFYQLAQCVFALRQQCGARLKIVVREVNTRLRYSQEALIARIGANLVVPAEIGYIRFLGLTSMVQGQVFAHSLPSTFEQAMKSALPDKEQGYLPPAEFSHAVADALECSRLLQIHNVLLRLPLAYGLQPLDALRYCQIKRPGDLCTSDHRNVYLFLYACRESDIDSVLERLFGLPVGELFNSEDRFLAAHSIRDAMLEFDKQHRMHAFPDFSAELIATATANSAETKAIPSAAPTLVSDRTGPAPERYLPPAPAVRRPLLVKTGPALTDILA